MIVIVTLGGVILQDFENPESIKGRIKQKLDTKKYLGGSRTIDAMGRDDDPLDFSGRFRGSVAEQRFQQVKAMAAAGLPVPLTWSSFSYQVMIESFDFDYQSPMEIPYRLSLEVLTDNSIPSPTLLQTIDEIFGTNLATALNFGTVANQTEITTSLNQLQTTASTIQTLSGSSSPVLTQLNQNIVSAQGVTQTAISALAGQTAPVAGSVFGGTAGLPPQVIAANVAGQASAFGQLSTLLPLSDVLGVMGKNVATVGP